MHSESLWAPISRIHLGLEIEVPWSSYFPEAQREWFVRDEQARKYSEFSPSELREFDVYCSELDSQKLPVLESIAKSLGLTRWADPYFEWVFPPIDSVARILEIIAKLRVRWALPAGRAYSLQITLGGVSPCPDLGVFMTVLELLAGIGSKRIMSALHPSSPSYPSGWARKWVAGYRVRSPEEILLEYSSALEIRTLVLPEDPKKLWVLLEFASKCGSELARTGHCSGDWRDHIAWELIWAGFSLDRSTWGNLVSGGELWRRYGEFLDQKGRVILEFLPSFATLRA